jgi:hypothetical protein
MNETPLHYNCQPRWRRQRRREMRTAGIIPTHRWWAFHLKCDFELPAWAIEYTIPGLSRLSNQAWFRPTEARAVIQWARSRGLWAKPEKVEFRHCSQCGRPLVGIEAEARRLKDESGPSGRSLPCGPDCARDQMTRLWMKLNKRFRRRDAMGVPRQQEKAA